MNKVNQLVVKINMTLKNSGAGCRHSHSCVVNLTWAANREYTEKENGIGLVVVVFPERKVKNVV
jgi:hypothetical protein